MDTTAIIVTATGLSLAVFVLWYFFFSAQRTVSTEEPSGVARQKTETDEKASAG